MPHHPAPHPSTFAAQQAQSGSGLCPPQGLHLHGFMPHFSHPGRPGPPPTVPDVASEQYPVVLHIYHLSDKKRIKFANHLLRIFGSGAYHAAVEVHGIEWSFGSKQIGTGVFACEPTACSAHTYKKPYLMGYTKLNEQETEAAIEKLAVEWQGRSYDLLTHNCTHFSGELCRTLGVGPMPSWVTSLAAAGARLDEVRDVGHDAKVKQGTRNSGTVSELVAGIRVLGREKRRSGGTPKEKRRSTSKEKRRSPSKDEQVQERDISRGSSSEGDDYKLGDYSRGCFRICC